MLQEQQTLATSAERGLKLAEAASVRGLLNSYLREVGIHKPAVLQKDSHTFLKTQPQGNIIVVNLPLSCKTIAMEMVYASVIGQHDYGPQGYEVQGDGTFDQIKAVSLIELLLEEVSLREHEASRESRCLEMRVQIENSVRRMSRYIRNSLDNTQSAPLEQLNYIHSEQSLLLGHPFHPTPKSAEGFTDEETELYSPEMGAAYSLHYYAASTELVKEEWISGYGEVIEESVQSEVKQQLGAAAGLFKLIPLHPWQAKYISGQEAVQELLKQGKLIDLGPLGSIVYPTSSVRTVWNPESGYFYKLPLHVRITNFIRENTPEQLKRTMDAARVLHHIKDEFKQEEFIILMETGYRTLHVPNAAASKQEQIEASFAVVYREASTISSSGEDPVFVVASLLEHAPEEAEPKLIKAMRQTNHGQLPDLVDWLKAYLSLSLLPLLQLLADKGISLEAHLQNCLVSIRLGMPHRFYVRDLEGVSINRVKAAESGWLPMLLSEDSPVLYSEEEAWLRLQYYYVVNHLGALIHTLARYSQTDEEFFWIIVKEDLQQVKSDTHSIELKKYIVNLLERTSLPAKANFISRFQGRGETPQYVNIPNPLNRIEVDE